MAVQQYDYTACCTGFLQQLPSFSGDPAETDDEGPFCRSGCAVTDGAGGSEAGGVGGLQEGVGRERRAQFGGTVSRCAQCERCERKRDGRRKKEREIGSEREREFRGAWKKEGGKKR